MEREREENGEREKNGERRARECDREWRERRERVRERGRCRRRTNDGWEREKVCADWSVHVCNIIISPGIGIYYIVHSF